MATVLQIKRSTTSNAFANIVFGELAFTTQGDVLFVGDESSSVSIPVGGRRVPGTLSANQAIVVNSTSWVDNLKSVDLNIANTATVNSIVVSTSITSPAQSITETQFEGFKHALTVASSKFVADGKAQQVLRLQPGIKYYFDQSDNTNTNHPVTFSETSDGTHNSGAAYTTGVTAVGTPGNAGAYTIISLEADAPTRLYYYCANHSGMGAVIRVHEPQVIASNTTVMTITGTLHANDVSISNNLTVNGDIILRGSSIQLGDGSDVISLGATVNTNIIPTTNNAYTLGSAAKVYQHVYANQVSVAADPTVALGVATKQYVDNVSNQLNANTIIVGLPTDGAWSNGTGTTAEGGVIGLQSSDKIADAIDAINEVTLNMYQNNYVRDVDATIAAGALGGAPLNTTLNLSVTGNANFFDINWGDGAWSNNTADSTPSHTYTDNSNSPFDVVITARNSNAKGTGNTATITKNDFITLYTGDPVATFAIWDSSSGGSEITEANINQAIYVDNDTTNANGVVATFYANYGDGTNASVANTTVAGGTQGSRLTKTYTSGTSTGSNTITFSINTHSTANPASVPNSTTKTIKIFNTAIAAPEGLSGKTITFTDSSVGTGPRVASGFIDNGSGSYSIGDTPQRYTTTGAIATSGTANTELTYNANAGALSAYVDGAIDGTINFTASDNEGSNASVVVVDEQDFYNFDDDGDACSAAARRYAQGLYSGFYSRISKSNLSTGAHTYKLHHSATGNTGQLTFIKDQLTGTPVIAHNGTSVTANAGTITYVSGVPYYTNDGVINVVGAKVSNVAGQVYRDDSTPFSIQSGSDVDGDSGSAFGTQSKSYTILPSSTLASSVPIANTGVGANVTIDTFQVSVNGGGRKAEGFQMRMRNTNGNGSYVNYGNTIIQAHNGTSTGVNESAIPVSASLGATYDTNGVRLNSFSSTNGTPTFSSSTDYYASNVWTGNQTVAGTDEAVQRYGTLKHDVTNYSTGYLPVGPNLSSGRTGVQYLRFAFKRTAMANFNIRLNSTTGIASLHIAAPATGIDSASTLNGWLDCTTAYGGAGTPGANTSADGNGSNGCGLGARVAANTSISNIAYEQTLGDQNGSGAYNNQILVSVGLHPNQTLTKLEVE